jgi:hypothetical protein
MTPGSTSRHTHEYDMQELLVILITYIYLLKKQLYCSDVLSNDEQEAKLSNDEIGV